MSCVGLVYGAEGNNTELDKVAPAPEIKTKIVESTRDLLQDFLVKGFVFARYMSIDGEDAKFQHKLTGVRGRLDTKFLFVIAG